MENAVFYYEGERLVFLTEEDARDYFFKENLYHAMSYFYNLNEFLGDKGYNCEDVFLFDAVEKADILSEYHEALFKRWVQEELVACDMYK